MTDYTEYVDRPLTLEEMEETKQELNNLFNSWGEPCIIVENGEPKITNTFFLQDEVMCDREL